MQVAVNKWGNSYGIRLPKFAVDTLNITGKEKLEMNIQEDGSLVIRRAQKIQPISTASLFEGYTGDYKCEEIETGAPVGNEIW
jgi:antitoxin MazE